MRVLFDQNVPRNLRRSFSYHTVQTAANRGWERLQNGELLQAAEAEDYDVFVTGDRNLAYQQNLSQRKIAIVELTKNNWPSVQPHTDKIVAAIDASAPGTYTVVDCQRAPSASETSGSIPKISIIIPALNEAESIGQVVASMPWPLIAECIVVDNGSTDATASIAQKAGARVIASQRGYGAACQAGSNAALPTSDILVYMDGDGSDIIADLPRLVTPIQNNQADFVLGSRIRGTREPGSMLPSQIFAGRLVGILLRLLRKGNYTDMGPFRAIRRSSLHQLQMSELTYGWNLEMQIKAATYKLRILEIPVDYRNRIGGTSKVSGNFSASLKAAARILQVLVRATLTPTPK